MYKLKPLVDKWIQAREMISSSKWLKNDAQMPPKNPRETFFKINNVS